ncbi:MAG: hypothetical protein QM755_22210 [Luteolibacter sp.]
MKTRWSWLAAGLMCWVLNSCSSSYESSNANIAPNVVAARRTADAAASQATVGERKGLATTTGSRVSMNGSNAARAKGSGPYGIDVIYYNDRAGLAGMAVPDTPVNGIFPVAGGVLEWGIKGKSDLLTAYYKPGSGGAKGRHFVEGKGGEDYSVVFYNRCNCDLLVVLSIDGVNVQDGQPAGVNQGGFVVSAGGMLEVEGYPTGRYEGLSFRFSSVAESKARYSTGDTRNVGVVGIAVFKPQGADPWKWVKTENRRDDSVF